MFLRFPCSFFPLPFMCLFYVYGVVGVPPTALDRSESLTMLISIFYSFESLNDTHTLFSFLFFLFLSFVISTSICIYPIPTSLSSFLPLSFFCFVSFLCL